MSDPKTEAELEANVATNQRYLDNLTAAAKKGPLTAAQQRSRKAALTNRAKAITALADWRAAHPASLELVDIGPEPLEDNSQASDLNLSEVDGFDAEGYEAQHGMTPLEAINHAFTAMLRPDFSDLDHRIAVSGGNFTEADKAALTGPAIARQHQLVAFTKGKVPFSQIQPYFPNFRGELGVIDPDDIHDLGADNEED